MPGLRSVIRHICVESPRRINITLCLLLRQMPSHLLKSYQRRIEICGGIGVGKTTLAARLAAHLPQSELICENFRANPLWAAYYEAPSKFVREKNISFLAQHFAEIKHGAARTLILDFSTFQDLA